ncbi:MAG TPA: glycerol-3-phosphate 1-O-acyltransferase PlsY [Phycisphaerae bacterium]|nr:glycerol-3-phosphate 1-O-acyltransferase PlsY [Phycisphaerae bacterium]HOB75459.1 glycerol-3-phosphate 1-O-acyltransferase PlsY [Phycisphaerae bacterium]HOJ55317.1 glycerol-3-phosphate 1-O-acyltransferase PlsY [Phycisphaerae bacterium]HOL27395.1 glycerol-3-phosphate 1-O-acyltransferase PlsY [Phycisphaerae bacterium]HPP21620.1 glycerol-3-phosphate 1-O-acyltransferase PlsY [Phycisphaerae bacterium]
MWTIAIACILVGYLVGSIPFGLLAGRLKGIDIRQHGSGNIGATNVGRVLGRWYGMAVFALDLLKGLAPVAVAGPLLKRGIGIDWGQSTFLWLWLAVAAACILGHMFPIYLGFKGGKGVATSLGVILGVYPYFTLPGLAAFALWVILTRATGYVSVGSVAAAGAFPVIFACSARSELFGEGGHLWPLELFAITIGLLVIYRHRGNLRRLIQGTEPKIGSGQVRTIPKQDL